MHRKAGFVLKPPTTQRTMSPMTSAPGFAAFVTVLECRIRYGETESAYRMLVEIGAHPAQAYEIIDGWPTGKRSAGVASARFATYIDNAEEYDWNELLELALAAVNPKIKEKENE